MTVSLNFSTVLLQEVDVSSIVRMNIPLLKARIDVVETFIPGWLIGACIAAIYKSTLKSK